MKCFYGPGNFTGFTNALRNELLREKSEKYFIFAASVLICELLQSQTSLPGDKFDYTN